jgi:hypothetical protein
MTPLFSNNIHEAFILSQKFKQKVDVFFFKSSNNFLNKLHNNIILGILNDPKKEIPFKFHLLIFGLSAALLVITSQL